MTKRKTLDFNRREKILKIVTYRLNTHNKIHLEWQER